MKKFLMISFMCGSLIAQAQMDAPAELPTIGERFDAFTNEWLSLSEELSSYAGLARFCDDASFRAHTLEVLHQIHLYDSVVISALTNPLMETNLNHREYKKTLKELQEFEEKYSTRNFIAHLKENCSTYRDLEHEKEALRKNSGMYSYDGQVLMVETDLQKFLKHISHRMVSLDKHLQTFEAEQISP